MSHVPALCDVNVLLALATDQHAHHVTALNWIATVPPRGARICRVAQLGFLRLLNNPAAMGENVLDGRSCWSVWRTLISDDRFEFIRMEPAHLDEVFARMTARESYFPRLWTDAYLAAYAIAAELTFVTFDKGFARFPELSREVLGAVDS